MTKTLIASLLALIALSFSTAAQNTTVTITGNTSTFENDPGWYFNRDSTSPASFNVGNADIGSGSLFVGPIAATSGPDYKFIGEDFINTPIANVDSISFDFKIGTGSASQFYMNVYANFAESPDLKFYDCRYDVIATTGSTSNFTTVTFDPTKPQLVAQRNTSPHTCPSIPANMDAFGAGSNIRAFAITLGDSTSSDAGMTGYFDKVVVSTTSGSTTYDFEPVLTPSSKDQCKGGGWMTFNTPVFKNQGDCIQFVNTGK